jgi:hypothetical protein
MRKSVRRNRTVAHQGKHHSSQVYSWPFSRFDSPPPCRGPATSFSPTITPQNSENKHLFFSFIFPLPRQKAVATDAGPQTGSLFVAGNRGLGVPRGFLRRESSSSARIDPSVDPSDRSLSKVGPSHLSASHTARAPKSRVCSAGCEMCLAFEEGNGLVQGEGGNASEVAHRRAPLLHLQRRVILPGRLLMPCMGCTAWAMASLPCESQK